MPEDLPVVASIADAQALQADIEALKARVTALEGAGSVTMPADVKAAFVTFLEWVKANV